MTTLYEHGCNMLMRDLASLMLQWLEAGFDDPIAIAHDINERKCWSSCVPQGGLCVTERGGFRLPPGIIEAAWRMATEDVLGRHKSALQ